MAKLTKVKLQPDKEYPFMARTEEYGRAEFTACFVYRYGKLREVYLYPRQQPDAKHYYHAKFEYPPLDWSISSWTHKGLSEPKVWLGGWCKEHKAQFIRFYVPLKSTHFTASFLSNFSINFDIKPPLEVPSEGK